jgi:hypothetical protein
MRHEHQAPPEQAHRAKRVALLPSCIGLVSTSCTCSIGDSNASGVDPFDTSVPREAIAGHGELEGTMAGSPTLTATATTRGKCGDVTGRAVG